MNIYEKFLEAKKVVEEAKDALEQAEIELWEAHSEKLSKAKFGTTHISDGKFKLTVVKKEDYKVDGKAWLKAGLESSAIKAKVKYEVDKKAYDALTDDNRQVIDKFVETKMAKPSFAVVEVENDDQN